MIGTTLTYSDIRGAVRLQEAVEVLPGFGDPVDDLNQVVAAHVLVYLGLYQLPAQEATQKTFDWLCVIGAQHPPNAEQTVGGETKKELKHRLIKAICFPNDLVTNVTFHQSQKNRGQFNTTTVFAGV